MVRVRYLGFKEKQLAHRMSYLEEHGALPHGSWVLHECDNPRCVNPKHLFLGDVQTNVDDMVQKGRNATHYAAHEVCSIRTRYMSGESADAISKSLNRPISGIVEITNGRSWAHLLGKDGQPTLADLKGRHDRRPNSKITIEQAREIKTKLRSGSNFRDLAAEYGLNHITVYDIMKGKTWREA